MRTVTTPRRSTTAGLQQRPAELLTPSALAAVHGSPQHPCLSLLRVWGTDGTARPYKPSLGGSMRASGGPPQRRNRDATTTHHDLCRTAGDPRWTPVARGIVNACVPPRPWSAPRGRQIVPPCCSSIC